MYVLYLYLGVCNNTICLVYELNSFNPQVGDSILNVVLIDGDSTGEVLDDVQKVMGSIGTLAIETNNNRDTMPKISAQS